MPKAKVPKSVDCKKCKTRHPPPSGRNCARLRAEESVLPEVGTHAAVEVSDVRQHGYMFVPSVEIQAMLTLTVLFYENKFYY
jgi:hypothetical protein